MEKRFLLAVILSFMTLYAWQVVSPKPVKAPIAINKTETITAQQDKDTSLLSDNQKTVTSNENASLSTSGAVLNKTVVIIEGEKLDLSISNIGGVLDSVFIKEYDETLPLTNIGSVFGFENVEFVLKEQTARAISYTFEDENYLINKTYTLSKEDYSVQMDISIQGKSKMSNLSEMAIGAYTIDMSSLDNNTGKFGGDAEKNRDKSLNEYVVYSTKEMLRKNNAYKFSPKDRVVTQDSVNWVGFRNRYYCAIFKPLFDTKGFSLNPVDKERLKVEIEPLSVKAEKEQHVAYSFVCYFGPEKLNILKKFDLSFEKIRRYYRFGLFDTIAKFILSIMNLIYSIVPNWGVCILLISIIIYFSMYPLTKRSMVSMKRMQAMQPKVNALKEKYKNNPQKMNEEMMKVYKENKINPLGGCLPMLLQTPVFIGLYQVLWRSVSLKGASFLWIKDLSAPDRLFLLPKSFPIIGNEINILPLIMMIVMYFQQKLSTQNMASADPAQIAQQKMMSKIFPLFLGFIFYKFASGLTLYFTMFYFFSTFTQWKMSKEPKVV